MALFSKGVVLTQHKEPAISKPIVSFTDSKTKYFKPTMGNSKDIDLISSDDIIALAQQANIFDDIDGKPLAEKIMLNRYVTKNLYINVIDDEPYVSSRIALLLHMQNEVTVGLNLCSKALGLSLNDQKDNIVIEVYKNMGDIKAAVPSHLSDIPVRKISGGYPALPSYSRNKTVRGSQDLLIGISALIHLYRAVVYNIVQSTTFVTVAGNSVANPMNLEVSFGMNFAEILDRCGINQQPDKVVNGGSMRGISVIHPAQTHITERTRSILAFYSQTHENAYDCIGCGRCERSCPVGLNPMYIYNIVERRSYSELRRFDPQYCIACGLCSYICPSRLPLASSVIKAKAIYADYRKEQDTINQYKNAKRQVVQDAIENARQIRAEKRKIRNERLSAELENMRNKLSQKNSSAEKPDEPIKSDDDNKEDSNAAGKA